VSEVFVDTWAWVALYDRHDLHHGAAVAAFRNLVQDGLLAVTTNAVLYEAITFLRYRAGHDAAMDLVRRQAAVTTRDDVLVVLRIDEALEQAAIAIFRRYGDKDFSFVDCLSFAVMQQRGIATALTGDKHFAQMGFDVLP
jgi:uncharacterized protein